MNPCQEIGFQTMTTTRTVTTTTPTTPTAVDHPSTAIAIFSQLQRVAESGCKINPELYYTHAGFPEHALQFSRSQYTYLTGGKARPDIIWQSALDNYSRCPPRRRRPADDSNNSPLRSRYVTAGVPWDLIRAGCPPPPSLSPQPADVFQDTVPAGPGGALPLPPAISGTANGAVSPPQAQSPGRICPAYPNIFDYALELVPMPPAPGSPVGPAGSVSPVAPRPHPRSRSHMLPLFQAGVLAATNNRTPIRRRVPAASMHRGGHGAQGPWTR